MNTTILKNDQKEIFYYNEEKSAYSPLVSEEGIPVIIIDDPEGVGASSDRDRQFIPNNGLELFYYSDGEQKYKSLFQNGGIPVRIVGGAIGDGGNVGDLSNYITKQTFNTNKAEVDEKLEKKATIIAKDTVPPELQIGEYWLDTSDKTYQGTVFENLDSKTKALETEVGSLSEQLAHTVQKMNWISIDEFPRLQNEADDTDRIQRALDFISSNNIRELRLSNEEYLITHKHGGSLACSIIVPSNVRIVGNNTKIKLVNVPSAWCRMLHFDDVKNIVIEGIEFNGNRYNVTNHEQMHILFMNGVENVRIKNCKFIEARGDGAAVRKGTVNPFSFNVVFEDCYFESCGRNGFTYGSGFRDVTLRNCVFTGNTASQHIDSEPDSSSANEGIKIEGCYCDGTNGGGMLTLTLNSTGAEKDKSHVINSTFINTEMFLLGSKNTLINNNRFTIKEDKSIYAYPVAFRGDIMNLCFENNLVEVYSPVTMELFSITSNNGNPKNIKVRGNKIITAGTASVFNIMQSANIDIANNDIEIISTDTTNVNVVRINVRPSFVTENIFVMKNVIKGTVRSLIDLTTSYPDGNIVGENIYFLDNIINGVAEYGCYTVNTSMLYIKNFVYNNNFIKSVTTPFKWATNAYYQTEGNSGLPITVYCNDNPEGGIIAPIGSTAIRMTSATSGNRYFIKESGAGNTGWVAKW